MSAKRVAVLALKVILLTFLLAICFSTASLLAGLADLDQTARTTQNADPESRDMMFPFLLMCFLVASALSYPIVRSKWTGWRLVITVSAVYYGISTFLT